MIEVTIPGRPPSPNDFGQGKSHWAHRFREMRTWRETATLIARSARPPGWHPLGRAILSVVFVVPDHQRRDLDNLIAGTKPLTDGIVDAGILVDDSTRVIVSASYSWRYQRGVSATIYRIEGDPDTQELWGS